MCNNLMTKTVNPEKDETEVKIVPKFERMLSGVFGSGYSIPYYSAQFHTIIFGFVI